VELPGVGCTRCTLGAAVVLGLGGWGLYRYGGAGGWSSARPDAETMAIVALTMGDAAAFFSAYNPSIMTTGAFRRKGGREAENSKRDLYRGAAVGTALALVVAAGGSMVTSSWWPLYGSLGVVGIQWAILWHTIENPWGEHGSIAQQPPGGHS
jgi:hypothetical protein